MSVEMNLHPEADDQLSKRTRKERKHLFINQFWHLEWREELPFHDGPRENARKKKTLCPLSIARGRICTERRFV
jgi:hypothetical protein